LLFKAREQEPTRLLSPLLYASNGQGSRPEFHAEPSAAADPNIANRVYGSSVFGALARTDGQAQAFAFVQRFKLSS
jgi:hypothetical protein